ncbi:MAG: FAD-dependent oxidoreductase [Nitrospirae bacterium]|nr:FAD-dependent oxidoreductase [Nitrospirota bacterium]
MKQYDIIIIGAGISGLSLAHYCARGGLKTLVIERSERVGGTFHSYHFEGDVKDFWLELGAHTCYNSYRNLLGIIEDCQILDRLIRREKVPFRLLVDNQIKSIPSQLNFIELLFSAPRLFTLKKDGQSVESYYSRIVGPKNFERVFAPAFNAVISQKANDFPADMLFKKRKRRKDIIKKFTFTDGVQTITDSIASQPGINLLTGKKVQAIQFSDNFFRIATADGSSYESLSLALATPVSAAAELLKTSYRELSAILSQIKVNTIETVGVAIRNDAVSLSPFAGIIATDNYFYSAVSRDTVPHKSYRGFSFHFKAGILSYEAKLRRISEVLGVKPEQLEYMVTKENIVPCLRVGHDKFITEIDQLIAGKRLLLTGNYFSGLAIEDCVSRSLKEFSRLKKS